MKNSSAQPSGESSIRFRRDYFIDSLNASNEWVEFPEPLIDDFRYYMRIDLSYVIQRVEDYERELDRGYKPGKDHYRYSDGFKLDSLLYDSMAYPPTHSLDQPVRKLLAKPEGWIAAIQILEYRTELLLFATGFHAVVNIPKFHPVLGFLQRPFSPGVTISFEPSATAFNTILLSPNQCDYLSKANGVQPNDFTVEVNPQTGKQEVKRRPNWFPMSVVNPNDVRANIINYLLLRQKFYLALSIPVEKLDALPDEFLLKSDTERLVPERLGVHWQNRYERIFRPASSVQTENLQRSMEVRLEVLKEDIKRLPKIA